MKIYWCGTFLVANLSFSMGAPASSDIIEVSLREDANNLYLYVENLSPESIIVNRRFAIGAISRGADVEFHFVKKPGEALSNLTAIIEPWKLVESDKLMLRENDIVGVKIEKCFIAYIYSLESGSYFVKAIYSPELEWEPFSKKQRIQSRFYHIFMPECDRLP